MRSRPNIILILADDLGWRDLSCYGSGFYETPTLDRLAANSVRFTNSYATSPVCSPSRASILTGKCPARLGVTDWIDWTGDIHPCQGRVIDVPYIKQLPLSERSIASALQDEGYDTWHVGKWHLGGENSYPNRHGFNRNIGGCEFGLPISGYYSPWNIPTLENASDGTYLTDHLTDKAIELIKQAGEDPFFLNLWHYAVHTPTEAPDNLVEKYRLKAKGLGLDKREALVDQGPYPMENWRNMNVYRRILQSDPVYAAMIENLDWNIGRLLESLEASGKADDTIVIFTSDNGGHSNAVVPPTSNLPLFEGKGWMYEGGTRVPLIVSWPKRWSSGTICDTPVTGADLYPTLLEAAKLPLSPDQHADGKSLVPLLEGRDEFHRAAIFWHYPHYGCQGGTPGSSVRAGDWKLIQFFEDGRLELYDLASDASEEHECGDAHPEVRERLFALLEEWRCEIKAKIPSPNLKWVS